MRAAGSIVVVIIEQTSGEAASKERVCISQNHSTGSAALEVTRIDLKLSRHFTPARSSSHPVGTTDRPTDHPSVRQLQLGFEPKPHRTKLYVRN